MKKIKLILFGASDGILQTAGEIINYKNCEIVALCDNDKNKQDLIYNDLPIVNINQLKNLEYDFILVSAWYSYHLIKNDLLNAEIPSHKIMPLLSIKTLTLLTEPIDIIPEEVLQRIFLDNSKVLNSKIFELNEVSSKYSQSLPIDCSNSIFNLDNYAIVAHAGGGIRKSAINIYKFSGSLSNFVKSWI